MHNLQAVPLRLATLMLFLLASIPVPSPTRAAPAAPTLTAAPTLVAATLPLGSATTATVELTNPTDQPVVVTVYEANAAPAVLPQQAPSGPERVSLPRQSQRVDPQIGQAQGRSRSAAVPFLIYLHDQADLSAAYGVADWRERGRLVYTLLTSHAERSQRELQALLRARGVPFRPLWLVNAVLAEGTAADVAAVAGRSEVALVRANQLYQLDQPADEPTTAAVTNCNDDQPESSVCWHLRKTGVDKVWALLGVHGEGVTIGTIDTGVTWSHPLLRGQYRGYREGAPAVHDYNWYDPEGKLLAPADDSGHGTHTLGTLIGGGSSSLEPAIGVAPGATWIAAKGCSDRTCGEADLLLAAQWMLAPTTSSGTAARPDLRPMIVNNSWGGGSSSEVYSGYIAAWRAAGMFPVFAQGNASSTAPASTCEQVLIPANSPSVVAVGGTGATDQLGWFSLLGPAVDPDGTRRIKPDFVAPGERIVSADRSGNGYRTLSGTSMATPHVAGTVALLWSANPALIGDYNATYGLLRDTAMRVSDTRCGAAGWPNNAYGNGRIDAFAAVVQALVDQPWLTPEARTLPLAPGATGTLTLTLDASRVPGPGNYESQLLLSTDLTQSPLAVTVRLTVTAISAAATLQGTLRSQDGEPLRGVVTVDNGPRVATNATGAYSLTLPLGRQTLAASAAGYFPLSTTVELSRSLLQDFRLNIDAPRLDLVTPTLALRLPVETSATLAFTISNSGTQPLVLAPQWSGTSGVADASGWLRLLSRGSTLAPGATTTVRVEARPLGTSNTNCLPGEQQRAVLTIASNDPRRSIVELPIEVTQLGTQQCFYLPLLTNPLISAAIAPPPAR